MKFVGVTACPTGIAHSAMAAEALETAATEKGHEIWIEIHGASGVDFVDPQVIRDADAANATPASPSDSAAADEEERESAIPTGSAGGGWGAEVRRWLMTGVSYM